MEKEFEKLEPKNVFKWFYEISQIPRGSGNEKGISDFLVSFAKARNLEVWQDKAMNVVIKKPATKGFENSKPVILQGHMDMVPEKEAGSKHDFLKDPIKWQLKGDMLYATGTTLGGDDGIAVAYCLAILDSNDVVHPPLEVLITTEEETGMGGAMAVSGEHLTGTRFLNIDSEKEGSFLVSCAGGANVNVYFDVQREVLKGEIVKISISNLLGGHSGMEIIKQRANAIKMLARILYSIKEKEELNIIEINGGSKHNAIPKDAYAYIAVKKADSAMQIANEFSTFLKKEYRTTDPDMKISIEKSTSEKKEMFTSCLTGRLIDFMVMVPDAVQYMNMEIKGLCQTSLNNGILEEIDGKLMFTISVRSSVKSMLDEVLNKLDLCAKYTKGEYVKKSEYPAWEYEESSPVREIAVKTYKEMTGQDATVSAIHAGLECGLLKKALPQIDAISFGPNLHDVHTPNEHMDIKSVERVWKFLLKYLEALK
ncbi:MAG: aminoacyl-histidine dipeptidase [Treponema sp.]